MILYTISVMAALFIMLYLSIVEDGSLRLGELCVFIIVSLIPFFNTAIAGILVIYLIIRHIKWNTVLYPRKR